MHLAQALKPAAQASQAIIIEPLACSIIQRNPEFTLLPIS
jgi:hypothetical protein